MMVETFTKTVRDLAEAAKDIKEYVPSFFQDGKLPDRGSENIYEPVMRRTLGGFTDYQRELLSEEYGLSETDIEKYSDWDDFEKNELNRQSNDVQNLENSDSDDCESDYSETDEKSEEDVYDENGTRELTEEEKQKLKDLLGWSDDKINNNCRIDKDGVIHYKTDCQDKEGQVSDCGVPYARRRFEYKGVVIEGVFPEFDSVFDTELSEEDYQASNTKQFSECNKKLKDAIENDPDLRKAFTKEQLEDIENGRTPRGYTWHHTEEPGKMQLVKTEDHDRRIGGAAHTGGNSIWGNKSVDKSAENDGQKGETF